MFPAPRQLWTAPKPEKAISVSVSLATPATTGQTVPKLLRAYLSVAAQMCAPPDLDAEFGTIDFPTHWIDAAFPRDSSSARPFSYASVEG